MKKKSLRLQKLALSKETIAQLNDPVQYEIRGGGSVGCVTAGNSCPYTFANVCLECGPPLTIVPVTQPCGTQACGGGTL